MGELTFYNHSNTRPCHKRRKLYITAASTAVEEIKRATLKSTATLQCILPFLHFKSPTSQFATTWCLLDSESPICALKASCGGAFVGPEPSLLVGSYDKKLFGTFEEPAKSGFWYRRAVEHSLGPEVLQGPGELQTLCFRARNIATVSDTSNIPKTILVPT